MRRAETITRLAARETGQTEAFLSAQEAWPAPTFDELAKDLSPLREAPDA
jgi:hypothetical protein